MRQEPNLRSISRALRVLGRAADGRIAVRGDDGRPIPIAKDPETGEEELGDRYEQAHRVEVPKQHQAAVRRAAAACTCQCINVRYGK